MSRPWAKDEFLSAVMHEFIEKANSIAKKITNSDVIKNMYVANRTKCKEDISISPAIRDFAYAPHRYNSEANTLTRICLTLDATLTTACQVVSLRGPTSAEGAACAATMHSLTNERLLQLGMMADAALEIDYFVHTLDAAEFDEANLRDLIDMLNAKLRRLFIDGQCIHVPGCTSVVLQSLRRARTFVVGGVALTIGAKEGLPAATVASCMRRMAAWAALAKNVIQAEFPSWDVLMAFQVFEVRSRHDTTVHRGQRDDKDIDDCLKRICNALNLAFDMLRAQYYYYEPVAINIARSRKCSNFEAWKAAVSKRITFPCDVLQEVLIRYATWNASSSDVERGFAVSLALRGGKCNDQHTKREEEMMILRCDRVPDTDVKNLIGQAGRLWRTHYGSARTQAEARLDKGVKHDSTAMTGEKGFLRARAAIANQLIGEAGDVLPQRPHATGAESWTMKHLKEYEFQQAKMQTSKVEAFMAGHLLPSEIEEQLVTAAVKRKVNLARVQKELTQEKGVKQRKLVKTPIMIRGANVFFDFEELAQGMQWHLTRQGATQVPERHRADIFVVMDPVTPTKKSKFAAAVSGGTLCTRDFITTGGKTGATVSYKRSISITRKLLVSGGFMHMHPLICSDLYHMLNQGGRGFRTDARAVAHVWETTP